MIDFKLLESEDFKKHTNTYTHTQQHQLQDSSSCSSSSWLCLHRLAAGQRDHDGAAYIYIYTYYGSCFVSFGLQPKLLLGSVDYVPAMATATKDHEWKGVVMNSTIRF